MKEFRARGAESPPVIRQWEVRRPMRIRRILLIAFAIYCAVVCVAVMIGVLLTGLIG